MRKAAHLAQGREGLSELVTSKVQQTDVFTQQRKNKQAESQTCRTPEADLGALSDLVLLALKS